MPSKSRCPEALRAFLMRDVESRAYVVQLKRERREQRKSNRMLVEKCTKLSKEKKAIAAEYGRLVRFQSGGARRRELATSLREAIVRRGKNPFSAAPPPARGAKALVVPSPVLEEEGFEMEQRVPEQSRRLSLSRRPSLSPPPPPSPATARRPRSMPRERAPPSPRGAPSTHEAPSPSTPSTPLAQRPATPAPRRSRRLHASGGDDEAEARPLYREPSLRAKLRQGMRVGQIDYRYSSRAAQALRAPPLVVADDELQQLSSRASAFAPSLSPLPSASAVPASAAAVAAAAPSPTPLLRRSGRRRDASKRPNYAEPSLATKLRRGMLLAQISYEATPKPEPKAPQPASPQRRSSLRFEKPQMSRR